jgi:hypothetical protein
VTPALRQSVPLEAMAIAVVAPPSPRAAPACHWLRRESLAKQARGLSFPVSTQMWHWKSDHARLVRLWGTAAACNARGTVKGAAAFDR